MLTKAKNRMKLTARGWIQRGFSLIEVLIALVILAVGVLGLAALQTTGIQYTHDAYIRSQATVIVYDLVERMRNNVDNANLYIANSDPAGTCDVTAGGVTNDLNCFFETIAAQVPEGTGEIQADPANAEGFLIDVTWRDRESGAMKTQQWAVEP